MSSELGLCASFATSFSNLGAAFYCNVPVGCDKIFVGLRQESIRSSQGLGKDLKRLCHNVGVCGRNVVRWKAHVVVVLSTVYAAHGDT